MNWRWEENLSLFYQVTIEKRIPVDLKLAELARISAILDGLFQLKYPFKKRGEMKQIFFNEIVKRTVFVPEKDQQALINIIVLFGEFELVWNQLPRDIQDWIRTGIDRCSSLWPHDIVRMTAGFKKMGLNWVPPRQAEGNE
jgi:hypothetical protein